MSANNQRGSILTYLLIGIGLIAICASMFASNITWISNSSRSLSEKTLASSTFSLLSGVIGSHFSNGLASGSMTAFPVDIDAPNMPMNGGILPKDLAHSKVDPWGKRIGVCSYFLGPGSFPVAFGSSHDGIVRGNENSGMTSIIVALVSSGPNEVFETECAHIDGAEVRPLKGGDDIVWVFSVNQVRIALDETSSGGPSLIQGHVETYSNLAGLTAEIGDVYLATNDNALYWYNEASQWAPIKANPLSGVEIFDISQPRVYLNRADTDEALCDYPIQIYNRSGENSWGKSFATGSNQISFQATTYGQGGLNFNVMFNTDTTNCGVRSIQMRANTAHGLYHYSTSPSSTAVSAAYVKNHSFEDGSLSADWLCSPSCTYSSTLSTKKNRRDGYHFLMPDNGVNQTIRQNTLGNLLAGTTYTITFDYSPSPGGDADTNAIRVWIERSGSKLGEALVKESGLGLSTGSASWKRYSFSFTGQGSTGNTVYIQAEGAADGISGMIDNIRLYLASDPHETALNEQDFALVRGALRLGNLGYGASGNERGANYNLGPRTTLQTYMNNNSTLKLFTFENRTLPASNYIAPGSYNADGTTSPGSADQVRSNALINTVGPVTDDSCTENGHNFESGAVITDYYGNLYVCQ